MKMAPVLTLAMLLSPAAVDARQQDQKDLPIAKFDHYDTSNSPEPPQRSYALTLTNGQPFLVTIQRTCEDAYDYTIRGILKVAAPAERSKPTARVMPAPKPLADKNIGPTTHEERYGGYIVDVIAKPSGVPCAIYTETGASQPADPQPREVEQVTGDDGKITFRADGKTYTMQEAKLGNAQFFVPVTTDEWDYSVSGGFAFSAPGDRRYFLAPKAGSDTVKVVTRDNANEGDAITSAGAFVHLFRSAGTFKRIAPTFGISVETNDKAAYFGGVGWRLGRVATLIGGVSLNQLSVLPPGIAEGSETENAELLANLPTGSKLRFMIGISFAFLPGGDRLTKPFAGEEKKPGEGK